MKRKLDHSVPDAGQLFFTYRHTVAERLAAGELRDVSRDGRPFGFRWPLAVTRRLWDDVDAVPGAYRRAETPRQRWQHLFLLVAPAVAQVQREGLPTKEINVVLRTTDAPERSREHVKTLVLRREDGDAGQPQRWFTLSYKGE